MKSHSISHVNPLMVFWLGLLTGALIVSLVFLYRFVNSVEYKAATLLKSPTYKVTNTVTKPTTFTAPTSISPTTSTDLRAFGDGPQW
ncbi:MAG: hypothetical protein WCT53_00310 [Candidatus Gracilibacteria bacterium]